MRPQSKFSLAVLLLVVTGCAFVFAYYSSRMTEAKRHENIDAASQILNPLHAYLIEHDGNASMPQALKLSDSNGDGVSYKTTQVHYPNQTKTPWERVGTKACEQLWITDRSEITIDVLEAELKRLNGLDLVRIHFEHPLKNEVKSLRTNFPSTEFELTGIVQP